MRFDHAGIATEDAAVLAERYESLLDAEIAHQETFDGMEIVFLDLGNGYFELLEPVAEDNAIARYLDRRGSSSTDRSAVSAASSRSTTSRVPEPGVTMSRSSTPEIRAASCWSS